MKHTWLISVTLIFSLASTLVLADPASKESVKTLMEKTGAGNLGVQMIDQLIPALQKLVPDAPENFWIDVRAEMNADAIVELVIPVYQRHFNEEDIKSINAFYDTEVGQKLIRVQPAIMQESMLIGRQWGEETARNVIEKYKAQSQAKP